MEKMEFYKFDGAGNDFVLLDNRAGRLALEESEVARICHRRYGVGADGLLMLNPPQGEADFEMVYYNSDGRVGTMCGNGGRCIAAFAMLLGMGRRLRFAASDGVHRAEIVDWDSASRKGVVRLGMKDVDKDGVRQVLDGRWVDTGSPHYVQMVERLDSVDVEREGRRLRNRVDLFPGGTNVDFVEKRGDGRIAVRTYERGVEAETWACGTGVTACAMLTGCRRVEARGGSFEVEYRETETAYSEVWLTGPVALNFTGEWRTRN